MIRNIPPANGIKALFSLLILAVALTARAQMEAMPGYVVQTDPSFTPVYSLINGPVGWTFQPNINISVTALGVFAGLPNNLEVGLWNSSGTLLASSTITAGATPFNQSLYESITPVTLDASQVYYIAAFSASGPFQALVLSPNLAPPDGNAIMSPDIQLGTVASANNGIFQFPGVIEYVPDSAIIAPNFEFTAVPEPSTFGLFGLGSLAFLARQRRR